jgi:hypothetical protein
LTGLLTAHVGSATGGDVRGSGVTAGVSMAVIERSGLGAEIDLAHIRSFDGERFTESGVTSFVLNVIGVWNDTALQPFVLAGVGLIRVRAVSANDVASASRTDLGFDAGAGAMYFLSDAVAIRGDLRYFRYFARHAELPLRDNGFFDFWRVSVGATFAWPIR